jgi:hypothetical protein
MAMQKVMRFETTMTNLGFSFYKVADGNSLFRAIAYQVHGDEEKHVDVRHKMCDYILGSEKVFAPMWGSVDKFKTYLKKLRTPKGADHVWNTGTITRIDEFVVRRCEGANE